MIRVNRTTPPPEFRAIADAGLKLASAYYAIPSDKRRQKSFDFDLAFPQRSRRLVYDALLTMFHHKCAYCEMQVDQFDGSDIDWFRPRRGVAESTGKYLGDHYWRQGFAWENLYLICVQCNRHKGNRFPVSGKRAPAHAERAALRDERPLLLDPCADEPDEHLIFRVGGKVEPLSFRGVRTIETLGLNRKELVEKRADAARKFLGTFHDRKAGPETLAELAPDQEYLALKYALIQTHRGIRPSERPSLLHAIKRAEAVGDKGGAGKVVQQDTLDHRRNALSTSRLDLLRARAVFVERIAIQNIGPISQLRLDLSRSTSKRAPCFALLGENSAGKSTVLKCVALTLGGRRLLEKLRPQCKAKDLIRHGARTGRVTIYLSGIPEPVEMSMTRSSGRFTFSEKDRTRAFVLGYGAARLVRDRGRNARIGRVSSRTESLFDPAQPLTNASLWLSSLDWETFNAAAKTLSELLPKASEATFIRARRRGSKVKIQVFGGVPQEIGSMSDGFQSMLGMVADIMRVMLGNGYQNMRSAQGMVLIDELGNHLHPSWKMRVLSGLRNAFPGVQFVFTTHDPLALRGLVDGEVAVLLNGGDSLQNLPSISSLRVDQLLTSPYFGMDSTLDPAVEEEARELRALSSIPEDNRTNAQKERLQALSKNLTSPAVIGATWQERLALEAAAQEISRLEMKLFGPESHANAVSAIGDRLRLPNSTGAEPSWSKEK